MFRALLLFLLIVSSLTAYGETSAVTVKNLGVPGANTKESLKRLPRILKDKPEHLVVFLGMNDALWARKRLPLANYKKNLETIVTQAKKAGVDTVSLVTIHPVNGTYVIGRHPDLAEVEDFQKYTAEYDEAVRAVAESTGAILVDWRALFMQKSPGQSIAEAVSNREDCLIRCVANCGKPDGVHLTAEGYRLLAQAVASALHGKIKAGDTVVCFGDSVTYGSHMKGEGTTTGETYPAYLHATLNANTSTQSNSTQDADPSRAQESKTDLVVYGGTAAAIVAAIQADAMGKSVIVVCPDKHLGGMTSSGLGWTDSKNGNVIGGLAREFYHRVWKHYRNPEAWKLQARSSYTTGAQPGGRAMNDASKVMWTFEPHVAERVFDDWIQEKDIPVHRDEWLDRKNGVKVENGRITSITTLSGKTYRAKMFIDATYEGDLMAAAGVTYRIGRDSNEEFDESVNGSTLPEKPGEKPGSGRYPGVSPYVIPGDPESGLITGVHDVIEGPIPYGQADRRLQAYNYRLCLTAVPENRVKITKPPGYNEADYELLFRLYEAGKTRSGFSLATFMPNKKTDSNSFGAFGTDYAGGNYSIEEGWTYGDASYEKRTEILRSHENYTRGLIWTIQNHPRIPAASRDKWSRWGLAKDEFTDNGNWPFQLYVREARRMMGETMMTEHHVRQRPGYLIKDSVGLGSYHMDSHKVRRIVYKGEIYTEGGLYITGLKPFPISYGSITPKRDEVSNLLVPITVSATHVAFGGIRMEPTYMILGQSAGTAASIAIDEAIAVQEVDYGKLKERLIADGMVLSP